MYACMSEQLTCKDTQAPRVVGKAFTPASSGSSSHASTFFLWMPTDHMVRMAMTWSGVGGGCVSGPYGVGLRARGFMLYLGLRAKGSMLHRGLRAKGLGLRA